MQSTSLTTVGKLKAHKNWIFIFSLVIILLASFVLPTLEPIYAKVKVPVASGKKVYKNNNTIIDASNVSSGYIMIKYTGSNSKIKVRITKTTTYTYDLNARNKYETFPLTEGNGTYNIKIFENVSGSSYAQIVSQDISVKLKNSLEPFLYPNQFCNYTANSKAVKKAASLVKKEKNQLNKVKKVYQYVLKTVSYDYQKAKTVQSGYLPNPDKTLTTKKGICFDYASLMTSMLRSQGIPTKLVIGYAGDVYHAWVSVYIKGKGWIDNIIYFDGKNWRYLDPTFASTGKNSASTKKYISNSKNYSAKFIY